jgi:hypothetical protein
VKAASCLLLIQGIYWLLTGLWGLIDIHSFMLVTGPKTDVWLVETVSILIIIIALTFLTAVKSREQTMPIILLAITGCIGLAGIDFYYSLNNIISPIYLLDGVVEIFFLIAWAVVLFKSRNKKLVSSPS